jgi:hypothetical protein
MSIDCGQYTGSNHCRFHVSAAAYLSFQDAYAEQIAPSEMLSMRDYCSQGMNPSEANARVSFENQAFGAFNVPASGARPVRQSAQASSGSPASSSPQPVPYRHEESLRSPNATSPAPVVEEAKVEETKPSA